MEVSRSSPKYGSPGGARGARGGTSWLVGGGSGGTTNPEAKVLW